ncbi:MAG: hypothetical protein IPK66_12575 [Rhodospirillales bacterium]|nr:hypothetical protein [Rhodospirillales bacterium]
MKPLTAAVGVDAGAQSAVHGRRCLRVMSVNTSRALWRFGAWMASSLECCPVIRHATIVVINHWPADKVAAVRSALAQGGADIFSLPLFSPDMNSIEPAFRKILISAVEIFPVLLMIMYLKGAITGDIPGVI